MKPLFKLLTALGLSLVLSVVNAQGYPNKSIKIVVPYPPGGIADTITRAVGDQLGKRLGQPVIIDNRPGGKQIIATDMTVKSPADGYTLLLSSMTNLSLNPADEVKQPYDVQKDLAPVSRLFSAPLLLVVQPSLNVKNVGELVQYAKKHPGKLSYASIGSGSSTHLAAELLNLQAGISMVHAPYRGSAPAVTDLLSGQVDLLFDGGSSSMQHVQSGKLNLLAVTSSKRFPYLPSVPTMSEAGVPGFDLTPWWGISVPAGTPAAIVDRLAKEIKAVVDSKELRDRFGKQGVMLESSTPEEYAKHIQAETARWRDFLKATGIRLDN